MTMDGGHDFVLVKAILRSLWSQQLWYSLFYKVIFYNLLLFKKKNKKLKLILER